MNKLKSRRLSFLLIVTALLVIWVQGVSAIQYNLDNFVNTNLVTELTANSGTTSVSAADGNSLSGVQGGERDLVLIYQSGSNNVTLDIDATEENLAFSAQTNTDGSFSVTWDGNDNNASTNAYNLNADLTAGGVNDSFVLNVTSDGNFDMTLTVCNSSSDCGQVTINETDDIDVVGRVYWIPFSDFSGSVNFGNDVDSVVLAVDPANEADFSVDFIETRDSSETLIDFGDLPASYNITTKSDDGAGHWNPGATIELRNTEIAVDRETDGQESVDATGDVSDEGGVVPYGNWGSGSGNSTGQIHVYVSGSTRGCLMGWIDMETPGLLSPTEGPDNSFDGPNETIVDNQPVDPSNNPNDFSFSVYDMDSDTRNVRFRVVPDIDNDGDCSDQAAVMTTDLVNDGEVEDYQWAFNTNAVTLSAMDASPALAGWPAFALVVAMVAGGAGLFVWKRRA
jgi:hypothetical protein